MRKLKLGDYVVDSFLGEPYRKLCRVIYVDKFDVFSPYKLEDADGKTCYVSGKNSTFVCHIKPSPRMKYIAGDFD